jgi:four helix bundle protein
MHTPLRQQLLDQVLAVIEQARPLLDAIARKDRDLASQLRRALNSIALNVAEGFGSQAGNARLRFQSAHGSLYEAQAALRLAAAWGYISPSQTALAVTSLDRLGARLYGLSQR